VSTCPECGREPGDDASVCFVCGTPLDGDPDSDSSWIDAGAEAASRFRRETSDRANELSDLWSRSQRDLGDQLTELRERSTDRLPSLLTFLHTDDLLRWLDAVQEDARLKEVVEWTRAYMNDLTTISSLIFVTLGYPVLVELVVVLVVAHRVRVRIVEDEEFRQWIREQARQNRPSLDDLRSVLPEWAPLARTGSVPRTHGSLGMSPFLSASDRADSRKCARAPG